MRLGALDSRVVALALVALQGCRCATSVTDVGPAELAIAPTALDFATLYVGQESRLRIEVANQGGATASFDVSSAPPFTSDVQHLELPRGERATVTVAFAPGVAGPVSGVLQLGAAHVALGGVALAVPECEAQAMCTSAHFDVTSGACVDAPASDGTACQTRCVSGACSAGTCVGTAKGCDDGDACTMDVCSEEVGCDHLPRDCPAPAASTCRVATCDRASGCGEAIAPDGTVCGVDDCAALTVDVCIAGQCVTRPRPGPGRCANRWVPSNVTARLGHAMVFDTASQTVVLFGGLGARVGGTVDDTWEWNGATWTQRFPATSGPPVENHAMAYDSFRQRAVLYGGAITMGAASGLNGGPNGTFEWDGQAWVGRVTSVAPPVLTEGAMAYDTSRRRSVLFGGATWSGATDQTWEWDGQAWAQAPDGGTPGPRRSHALAYDSARRRVVLFGGTNDARALLGDTWTWDGRTWSQLATARSPPARFGHAMAFDEGRQRLVLFGGQTRSGAPSDDTWEWDGQTWTEQRPATAPGPRLRAAMAYDAARGEVVLFGGLASSGSQLELSDTWGWDGSRWSPRGPGPTPAPRDDFDLTYDGARQKIVLFGGLRLAPLGVLEPWLADTWEWDGAAWLERRPATAPPASRFHRMAYDELRQRVVLHGGAQHPGPSTDTWEWDGTTWSLAPASSVPAGGAAAMTWNPTQARTLLVTNPGTSGAPVAATWAWDGAAWAAQAPGSPLPAGDWAMTYDAARQAVIAVVVPSNGYPSETWVWQGGSWSKRQPVTAPYLRTVCGLADDPARQRVVLFGGDDILIWTSLPQTWEWDGTDWTLRKPGTTPFPGFFSHGSCALAYDAARQRVTLFDGFNTWRWVP